MLRKQPVTYIMASNPNGTLYTGASSNLCARVWAHRNKVLPGFTAQHDVRRLVYYELHDTMEAAILREKRMKKWLRAWKVRLINEMNPGWRDLYPDLFK